MGTFLKNRPHTPKKLKSLFECSHIVCAESTDLAQITSYPSAMANSIVFVRLRTKTVICYTAHRRFISAMSMIWGSKFGFFLRLLKCRKNLFVSTRWHNLRGILPRSSTKSFAELFQKRLIHRQTNFLNIPTNQNLKSRPRLYLIKQQALQNECLLLFW